MILEVTGRTKKCTDCGTIAHNTVMQTHICSLVDDEEITIPKLSDKELKKAITVLKSTKIKVIKTKEEN